MSPESNSNITTTTKDTTEPMDVQEEEEGNGIQDSVADQQQQQQQTNNNTVNPDPVPISTIPTTVDDQSVAETRPSTTSTTANSNSTISSSGSSTKCPLLSNGEQTMIRVYPARNSSGHQVSSGGGDDVPETNESNQQSNNTIPPFILNVLNQYYTGINYYDKLQDQNNQHQQSFDYMSDALREVERQFRHGAQELEQENEEEEEEEEEDDLMVVTRCAAKHAKRLSAATTQNVGSELKRELAQKLDYISGLLVEKVEVYRAKVKSIKVTESMLAEGDGKFTTVVEASSGIGMGMDITSEDPK